MRRTTARRVARLLATLLVAPLPAAFAPPAAHAAPPAVTPGGTEVLAGRGDGDGALATQARLVGIEGIAYAAGGDLLVATWWALRRVDAQTGVISTILTEDYGGHRTFTDVVVASDGTIYAASYDGIRAIAPGGGVTTVVPHGSLRPEHLALAPDGALYVSGHDSALTGGGVWRISGGTRTFVAGGWSGSDADGVTGSQMRLQQPGALAFTAGGDLLVADEAGSRIRRIAGGLPSGIVDTVAGGPPTGQAVEDGQDATSARVVPLDLAVAPDGAVLYAEGYAVRRFPLGGTVSTVDAGGAECGRELALRADGAVVAECGLTVAALAGGTAVPLAGGGTRAPDGLASEEAWLTDVRDVAAAPDGTVYVLTGSEIRSIGDDGLLGTVVTGLDAPRRMTAGPDGTLYVTEGPTASTVAGGTATPFAGVEGGVAPSDGAAASGVAFGEIHDLAADSTGALYLRLRAGCAVYRVDGGVLDTVAVPPCGGLHDLGSIALTSDDRLVSVREGALHVEDSGGVLRLTEPAWSDAVAVGPDGTIHGMTAALHPDGSYEAQTYPVGVWWSPPWPNLTAETGGTLLAHDYSAVVRLTPAAQTLPPAVTGLTVTPGPGTLTLSWDAAAADTFTSHLVRIRPGTVAPTPVTGVLTTLPSGATSVVLRVAGESDPPGLRSGSTYSVGVWRTAPAGRTAPATGTGVPLADTESPPPPASLTLSYLGGNVHASWPHQPTDDFAGYYARLVTGPDAPGSWTAGTQPATQSDGSASWPVDPDTVYTVAVYAYDLSGNVGAPVVRTISTDVTPPAKVTGLTLAVEGDHVLGTWDPPAGDVTRVVVSPTSVSPYYAELTPGQTSFEFTHFWWGYEFTASVQTYDAAGNASGWQSASIVPRMPGTLTFAASASTVTYGTPVTFTGSITHAETHQGIAGQGVDLWARVPGQPFQYLTSAGTNAQGGYAFTVTPKRIMEYQVRHPAAGVVALTSAVRRITVRAKVTAALSAMAVAYGSTAYLTSAVIPTHAYYPLTLQRLTADGWKSVTTLKTNSSSRARFALRPPRGTWRYRVVFVGHGDHATGVSPSVTLKVT